MSSPLTRIVPAVGFSKPAIIRSVVVLPQPDGPRNETNSPRSAARLKSRTAAVSPNFFWIPVNSRNDIGSLCLQGLAGATDGDLAARAATDQRDGDHRQPGDAEADESDGSRLVCPVRAEQRQVGTERRPK